MKLRFLIAAIGAVCLLCSAAYSDPTVKDAVQLARAKTAAISPDGTLIATGAANDIALWSAADGKSAGTLEGYKHEIYRLQQASFAPDGSRFAYGTWNTMADNCVCVADSKTGKPMVTIGLFSKETVFATVALSPDGKTLVAVPNEGASPAILWHLK